MGLALVAAALAPAGHQLHALDGARRRPRFIAAQATAGRADLALLAIPRGMEPPARRLVAALLRGGVPVALSGPDVLRNPQRWTGGGAWAVVGDGSVHSWGALPIWCEATVVELVAALERGGDGAAVPGVVGEGDAPRLRPRDRSLWPGLVADRALFPIPSYCGGMLAHRYPYTALLTSRGCGLDCAYCALPGTPDHSFVARAPEAVADEMEWLRRDHGVRSVHIEDDRFLADPERVARLCAELRRRGVPAAWELPNGIRIGDLREGELVREMASAGCAALTLSIESLHRGPGRAVLPWSEPLDEVRACVERCKAAGLRTEAYFLIGHPGDTADGIRAMLADARRLPLDGMQVSVFRPVAGSELAAGGGRVQGAAPAVELLESLRRRAMIRCHAHPRRLGPLVLGLLRHPRRLAVLARKLRTLMIGMP